MDTTTITTGPDVPEVEPSPNSTVDAVLGGALVPGLRLDWVRVPPELRLEDVLAQLGDVAVRIDDPFDPEKRQRQEDAEVDAFVKAATVAGFLMVPEDVIVQKREQVRQRQQDDAQAALHAFRDATQWAAKLLTADVQQQIALPTHTAMLGRQASQTEQLLARLLDLTETQVAQAQLRTAKITDVVDAYRRTPDRAGNVAWQQAVERFEVPAVQDEDDVVALLELRRLVTERQRARLSPRLQEQIAVFRRCQGEGLRDAKVLLLARESGR